MPPQERFRVTRRRFLVMATVAVGLPLAAAIEACSPGNPRERTARDFTEKLIKGDKSGAMSMFAPDQKQNMFAQAMVDEMIQALGNCAVGEVILRGQEGYEQATVMFKNPCGRAGKDSYSSRIKLTSLSINFDRANNQDYIAFVVPGMDLSSIAR